MEVQVETEAADGSAVDDGDECALLPSDLRLPFPLPLPHKLSDQLANTPRLVPDADDRCACCSVTLADTVELTEYVDAADCNVEHLSVLLGHAGVNSTALERPPATCAEAKAEPEGVAATKWCCEETQGALRRALGDRTGTAANQSSTSRQLSVMRSTGIVTRSARTQSAHLQFSSVHFNSVQFSSFPFSSNTVICCIALHCIAVQCSPVQLHYYHLLGKITVGILYE